MPTFREFCGRTKVRPDFADQLQVRYRHTDGKDYDTWISGEEVEQRLKSAAREEQLRGLSRLDREQLRQVPEQLRREGRQRAEREWKERLGDFVEGFVGGNVIGDSLAGAVRGREKDDDPGAAEREKWRARLQDNAFYDKVLELAWIQLAGSFPEDDWQPPEPDDWV